MVFESASAEIIGKTVCDLVAIKALSGAEAPVADYIQKFLAADGLRVERDSDDNLVAIIEPQEQGDPKSNTLLLSGHMDTVVPVEGWTTDPWKPEISGSADERRITGLGASDMKSGVAVMLHLARHLVSPRNGLKRLRIVLALTVCEETPAAGKRNGVNRVLEAQRGRWALTTEASCEAALPTIAVGCQGHAVAVISLRGRSAHSATPEGGRNAIHAAGKICARVERLHAGFKPVAVLGNVHAHAAAAVTLIKGGAAGNIIPEQCEMTLSRRLVPGETVVGFESELRELTANLDGVSASWKLRCDAPGCVADSAGPLLKCASQVSHELFGEARYSWNHARTDMVLFKQAGLDVLNIGPGLASQAHAAGEYVRLIDLPRSANLILETLKNLDGVL